MRTTMTALVAAGVLLLGACGGDDDDAKANDKKNEAPADAGKGGADSGFCKDVVKLMNNPSSGPTTQAIAAAKRLDPPDEIKDDWNTWLDGVASMQPGSSIDPSDPAKASEYQKMAAATSKVLGYIQNECGLGNVAPPTSGASG